MSDKPCKKIDIYVNGVFTCSTMQSRTINEAIDRFKANPKWMGLRNDGSIGVCIFDPNACICNSITAWWSSNQ